MNNRNGKNKRQLDKKLKKQNINISSNLKQSEIYTDIYLDVSIQNKNYKIFCGDGKKKIKWLIDVVIHKHDERYALETGR